MHDAKSYLNCSMPPAKHNSNLRSNYTHFLVKAVSFGRKTFLKIDADIITLANAGSAAAQRNRSTIHDCVFMCVSLFVDV